MNPCAGRFGRPPVSEDWFQRVARRVRPGFSWMAGKAKVGEGCMPSQGEKTAVHERRLVQFYINGRAYAINIYRIQEIIYSKDVTPVPKAQKYILGVINLRGQIVPVLSLRRRLGLNLSGTGEDASEETGVSTHVLIVRIGKRIAGLLVDSVREVLRLEPGEVHPPDELFSGKDCQYLEGLCHVREQMVLILDLDRLLSAEDLATVESP